MLLRRKSTPSFARTAARVILYLGLLALFIGLCLSDYFAWIWAHPLSPRWLYFFS